MILEKEYQRERAVMYARKYALVRNPLYNTFAGIGGNCTNFVSQCVLAGSCVMNFTPVFGWFYLSLTRRSASWTGVTFFFDFMTQNTGIGPFGSEVALIDAQIGDVIQLSNGANYYHSLLISRIENGEYYVCANSDDALDRPLSTYTYVSLRVIHIRGVRYDTRYVIDCFESLYSPPIQAPNESQSTQEQPQIEPNQPQIEPNQPQNEQGTPQEETQNSEE